MATTTLTVALNLNSTRSPPTTRKTRASRGEIHSDIDSDDLDEDTPEEGLLASGALDDDEEEADLKAAIAESLATAAGGNSNGAGPSGSGSVSGSGSGSGSTFKFRSNNDHAKASLRALAAERRARSNQVVDDSAMLPDDSGDDEEEYKPSKVPEQDRFMTIAKMKVERREKKKQQDLELKPFRQEVAALKKQLGRKPTVAERTTVALYMHHPELKNVWGDLEAAIPIPQRERAQQPEGFKATLLPFQQVCSFNTRIDFAAV